MHEAGIAVLSAVGFGQAAFLWQVIQYCLCRYPERGLQFATCLCLVCQGSYPWRIPLLAESEVDFWDGSKVYQLIPLLETKGHPFRRFQSLRYGCGSRIGTQNGPLVDVNMD